MRAVVQRVSRAHVSVDAEVVGAVRDGAPGLVVLLGAGEGDDKADADYLAAKITGLRIFEDEAGKMNLSVGDVGGSVLVISQFTLYGDCRKGRRPSFVKALEPTAANALVEYFVERIAAAQVPVETGRFRAHMRVDLINDGPVTLLLDSNKAF